MAIISPGHRPDFSLKILVLLHGFTLQSQIVLGRYVLSGGFNGRLAHELVMVKGFSQKYDPNPAGGLTFAG